jgi:hypothetical protein
MEGYRLVGIRVSAPSRTAVPIRGQLVPTEVGENGQKIPRGEQPMFDTTEINMPVGTIFMNYVPDREWPYSYSGTLYCLVPEWQIVGIMEGK